MALFRLQYAGNHLYRKFCDALKRTPDQVRELTEIPFLPVSFFKTHTVVTGDAVPEQWFESSTTTGTTPSRHYIKDTSLYEASLLQGFQEFYGPPSDYTLLALLPGYLERPGASLVHMAETLMQQGGKPDNGFYLHDQERLFHTLQSLERKAERVLLLGVTFALLDFAAAYPVPLSHTIVMETGGMKGRKKEWTRPQVHEHLKAAWGLREIHAEYGMTEMLSQAYSRGNGIFHPASTLRIFAGDLHDPLDIRESGTGRLHVIDLANRHSCAFIATDDAGTVFSDGSFTVTGRVDHSELRGCSLMAV